jgi:predicted regulator of Ras-like GTPase activity (Roadblock/LC7/MglB family)
MLRSVDAAQALADLTEISSQIVHVAIIDGDGAVLASTLADERRAASFAEGVAKLVEEADAARALRGLDALVQLEAATFHGSVFVVRSPDGPAYIAAVTRPEPTVGLVFYDLKHCLKSATAVVLKPPARTPRKKKADASA